ncbi:hypothetical protein ABT305_32785 [Streptomyces parvus]
MNLFLNYLVVAALFALVLLPTGLGIARERRIDRQLRDAARGEAEPTETESALPVRVRTGPAVLSQFVPEVGVDPVQRLAIGPDGGPGLLHRPAPDLR